MHYNSINSSSKQQKYVAVNGIAMKNYAIIFEQTADYNEFGLFELCSVKQLNVDVNKCKKLSALKLFDLR